MDKEILGIDTETVKGYARMISDGRRVEHVDSFEDVIKFLEPLYGKILLAWHMDFDAQAMMKYLSIEQLRQLYETGVLEYGRHTIKYRKGKYFAIDKRSVFDLCQFYNLSLKVAAERWLDGKHLKTENVMVEAFKLNCNTQEYLNEYWKYIADYCKNDAYLVELLGIQTRDVFQNEGIPFRRPMSQASIAQEYILQRKDYPKSLEKCGRIKEHRATELSFYGGWFETFQRGVFHDVYDYDIVSAYPSVMQSLPHWYDGWIHFVDPSDEDKLLKSRLEYGWVLADFDCPYIPFKVWKPHEVVERMEGVGEYITTFKDVYGNCDPRIYYPSGERRQLMTLAEYRYLNERNLTKGFDGGYVWIPSKHGEAHQSPFDWIPMAFENKAKYGKKDFRREAWKILMNSAYGKTAQRGGMLEDHRYSSYITAMTRLKIARAIEGSEKHIINIATDGIMSTVPLDLDFGKELGQWEQKKYEKVIIVGNGMYQKWENGQFETRARGLTDRRDFDMESFMKQHLDEDHFYYGKPGGRPCSLGEVLTHTKQLTKEDINVWKLFERKLNINADTKRKWDRDYVSFREFFDNPIGSRAWSVEELKPEVRR